MFKVGDKVVYPMHGAGVIEAIEEKEVLGAKRRYYIMKLPCGNMKVMIPIDNIDEIGLRQVVDAKAVKKVLSILQDKESAMSSNWNRRYRANLEKRLKAVIYTKLRKLCGILVYGIKRRAFLQEKGRCLKQQDRY